MDPFANLEVGDSSSGKKGKALYTYAAQGANQLSLTAGEDIMVLTNGGTGGWSKGQNSMGKICLP